MTGQTFQKMTTLTTTNTTHALVESFWDATLFAGEPGSLGSGEDQFMLGFLTFMEQKIPRKKLGSSCFWRFSKSWGVPQIIQTHCDLGTSSLTCFCSELLTYLFQSLSVTSSVASSTRFFPPRSQHSAICNLPSSCVPIWHKRGTMLELPFLHPLQCI